MRDALLPDSERCLRPRVVSDAHSIDWLAATRLASCGEDELWCGWVRDRNCWNIPWAGHPQGGEKGGDLGMNSTGEAQLLVILINYRYIFIHLIETYYMFKFRCTCDTCWCKWTVSPFFGCLKFKPGGCGLLRRESAERFAAFGRGAGAWTYTGQEASRNSSPHCRWMNGSGKQWKMVATTNGLKAFLMGM